VYTFHVVEIELVEGTAWSILPKIVFGPGIFNRFFFYSFNFLQILSEFHAKANPRKCIQFSLACVNEKIWALVFLGNLSKSQLRPQPTASFNRKRIIRLGRRRFSGRYTLKPFSPNKTFILRNGLWGGDNNAKRAQALRGISCVLIIAFISSVTVAVDCML